MHDPHAVHHLLDTPGADPVHGRVAWSPSTSLWNGGMAAVALVAGPLAFSPAAFAIFLAMTGITLLLGHSVGYHRRLIHGSFQCPLWLERLRLAWDVRTPATLPKRAQLEAVHG
jgi:sn-1 stearoyl-lipid 9-desaturase